MAWVKLDEDFASHPKVIEAGPLGIALQVAALCYCNRHLTDGYIGRAAARSLLDFEGIAVIDGMRGDDVEADYVIGCLIEAELWHGVDHDCPTCPPVERGYYIHDYLEMQPSKEAVLAKRAQTAEAGRRGGQARGKRNAKRNASETPSEPEADRQAKMQAESKPVPGPVPVPVPGKDPNHSPSAVADPEVSEDARRLTRNFALAVRENGFKVPKREQKAYAGWLVDMDRLLRLGAPGGDPDPQQPAEVEKVIRYATSDGFWKANIGSPSKFREQYPKLRLRMMNGNGQARPRQDAKAAQVGPNAR